MLSRHAILAVCVVLTGLAAVAPAQKSPERPFKRFPLSAPSEMKEIIPGQILVKFRQDFADMVDRSPFVRMSAAKGKLRNALYKNRIKNTGWTVWQVDKRVDTRAMARDLLRTEGVAFAQPVNRVYPLLDIPNDPDFGVMEDDEGVMFGTEPVYYRLWHLIDTNLLGGFETAFVRHPNRWYTAATRNPKARRIGFVDTGADLWHPDFANAGNSSTDYRQGGNVDLETSNFWQFGEINPNDTAIDLHGHGTHVMGLAMAAGNNGGMGGHGTIGSAYGAIGSMQRVFDSEGVGTDSDAAAAIFYLADIGTDVINVSLGTENFSQIFQDAVTYAWQKGALVVVAGNEDGAGGGDLGPIYPAACSGALGVTANGPDLVPAVSTYAGTGYYVDVAAPGGDAIIDLSDIENPVFYIQFVWSVAARYPVTASANPLLIPPYTLNYSYLAGTSMACPIVAGVGALFMDYKSLTHKTPWGNHRTYQAIQRGAIHMGAPNGGWEHTSGFGSLDADATLADVNARGALIGGAEGIVYLNGIAQSNIQIRAQRTTGVNPPTFSTTTKADGTYRFDGMPEGIYRVWTQGGAASKEKLVRIRNGADQTGVDFWLGTFFFDSTRPTGFVQLQSPGLSTTQLIVTNFASDPETAIDKMTFRVGTSPFAQDVIAEQTFLVGDSLRIFSGLNLSTSATYYVVYRIWNGAGLMTEYGSKYQIINN